LTYPKQVGENRWIIEVKGIGGSDEELYIELPPRVLNQMGWDPGDLIEWTEQEDGYFILKKKD
jgi:hypothetical protein